ncbi:MAG: PIG-L family deacetylase [Lachnospiraceae bacterium]|nr:PIG-L family deacetylase [Lachnospiraceae bacterium]
MRKTERKIKKIKKILGVSLAVLAMCTLALPINVLAAIKVPLDTSIEPDRNAGTDLFDTKCFYKNVLDLNISSSDGQNTSVLHDEKYSTSLSFAEGTKIEVKSDTPMHGLYIIWDSLIGEWNLNINGNDYTYGKYGFLHEYIELPEECTSLVITVPDGDHGVERNLSGQRISDIIAFDSADLPVWVQTWEPPCEEADILAFSTHSDDEHIFLGGLLPIYQVEKGVRVQFAYLTQHWNGERIREHEKLNGIWLAGAKYYPILGTFDDAYSKNYEGAAESISEDDAVAYIAGVIRRTHPQVVVTQDLNGEYGHGQHMFLAKNTIKGVEQAGDESYDGGSLSSYGTWSTPKLYIHLYGEEGERTVLDMRTPLENFGGKRAIDIARQAYLCHQSQQWCDFTVDDYGPYSAALFGLYSSTTGPDTNKNDLMENLVSYDEQEEIKRQEEARLEEERLKAEQEEKERLEKEAALKEASENKEDDIDKKKEASMSGMEIFILAAVVVAVLMTASFGAYLFVSSNNKKKRKKRRRRRR